VRISSLVCLVLLCACRKSEEKPEEPQPLAVRTAPALRGDVARIVEVAGALEPPPGFDVKLAPLVAGRLAQVLVAEGDAVKKGQPLARLEATALRDAVAQARAQVGQARAQASNAKIKLSRANQAFDAGVAARQEVDDANLADESAQAAVRTAGAVLSTALNQEDRGELRAPFDGVVAKISAASGEPVDPSRTVVEVSRVDPLELRAGVAPEVGVLLHPGQHATVGKADAEVFAVAPVVDPATGALLVRIRVPNPQGSFKANSAAHARIVVDVHKGVLTVPKVAITGGDPVSVEIVDQGKAKQVPVKLGYDDGEKVEIADGLKGGETVIVQGGYAVPDGTPVAAADAGPAENAAIPAERKE
jgi:membrane fusion protein (multidrug efflux system)